MNPDRRRVVVITGASAGVGRAAARAFARTGAVVGLIARSHERLQRAKLEVDELGGIGVPLPADVADAGGIEDAAEEVERRHGPIDVWVNNAMASVFSPVHETTAEEFERVIDVTYLGAVHGTLAALRRMRSRDEGSIIQVGSALAYRGIPLQSAYCAAKHALQGFCDSLRAELLHDGSGVRLTMVQLPAMNTPQFDWVRSRMPHRAQPVPPIYQPDVAAEAIVWASQHDRREIWVGAPTVKALVGNRIAPGLLDRYLGWIGYESQQTAEPEDPNRPHNLWQPVPGDPVRTVVSGTQHVSAACSSGSRCIEASLRQASRRQSSLPVLSGSVAASAISPLCGPKREFRTRCVACEPRAA